MSGLSLITENNHNSTHQRIRLFVKPQQRHFKFFVQKKVIFEGSREFKVLNCFQLFTGEHMIHCWHVINKTHTKNAFRDHSHICILLFKTVLPHNKLIRGYVNRNRTLFLFFLRTVCLVEVSGSLLQTILSHYKTFNGYLNQDISPFSFLYSPTISAI